MDLSSEFGGLGKELGSSLTSSLFNYMNTQVFFTHLSIYSLSNDNYISCWMLSAWLLVISVLCGSTAETLATKQIEYREFLRTVKTLLDSMTVITVVASMLMTAIVIHGKPVRPYTKKKRDPQGSNNTNDTTDAGNATTVVRGESTPEAAPPQSKPPGTEEFPVSAGTPSNYSPF